MNIIINNNKNVIILKDNKNNLTIKAISVEEVITFLSQYQIVSDFKEVK